MTAGKDKINTINIYKSQRTKLNSFLTILFSASKKLSAIFATLKKQSVRTVTAVILSIVVCVFISKSCQAIPSNKTEEIHVVSTEYLSSDSPYIFNSLLSLLLFNSGDLSLDESHSHLDKKTLLRLFILLKYTAIHASEYAGDILQIDYTPDFCQKQTIYYVYRLRKIII